MSEHQTHSLCLKRILTLISGFANLSVFWWLNIPLKKGAKKLITLADLEELPEDFCSEALQSSLETAWDQGRLASRSRRVSISNFG
jgi:hypothetical protein